jgi:hypothetical protein
MRRFVTLFLSIAMVVVFFNCEELITGDDKKDTEEKDLSEYSSEELADTAAAALGETMTDLMGSLTGSSSDTTSGSSDPSSMDMSGVEDANNLFRGAVDKDPSNAAANFGAALTELMLLLDAESTFMTKVTRWEAFLDTTDIFGEPYDDPGLGKISSSGYSLVAKSPLTLEPTPHFAGSSYLKAVTGLPKYAQTYPQFSDWQNLVESEIMPKVSYAIERLDVVEDDPDFVFKVTPDMQGNPAADTLQLDLTEVYLMDAVLHGVEAVCNIAIAYNLDMATYDTSSMKQMLAPSGDFMKIRSGKESAMPTALDDIVLAIDKTDAALAFLEAETDDQIDDIITLDMATQAEIDMVKLSIDSLKQAFTGPVDVDFSTFFAQSSETVVSEPISDGGSDGIGKFSTMSEIVTIDLTALFDGTSPFEPKSLVPAYTVEVGLDTSWEYQPETEVQLTDNAAATATLTFSEPGEYYFQFWKSYDPYWTEESGSDWNVDVPEFEEAVNWKMDSLKTEYGDSLAYANVSVYWSYYIGENDPATGEPYQFPIEKTFSGDVHVNFALQYPDWVDHYPIIVWDADTYTDWIAALGGDFTFNGLFPNFDQAAFEGFFGLGAESWSKKIDPNPGNTY